jgi:hypothetical protein
MPLLMLSSPLTRSSASSTIIDRCQYRVIEGCARSVPRPYQPSEKMVYRSMLGAPRPPAHFTIFQAAACRSCQSLLRSRCASHLFYNAWISESILRPSPDPGGVKSLLLALTVTGKSPRNWMCSAPRRPCFNAHPMKPIPVYPFSRSTHKPLPRTCRDWDTTEGDQNKNTPTRE